MILKNAAAARVWHFVTALVVTLAVIGQLYLLFANVAVGFEETAAPLHRRLVEFFSYFTIQSNILVAITTGMLAVNPERSGLLWRVLRLASLFGITVTLVIYHVVLARLANFEGLAAATNVGLHYVAPILAIVGWFLFGPRPRFTARTLLWAACWPAAYLVYTLVHGAFSGFYPYPFVNVDKRGLGHVLVTAVGLVAVLLAIGAVYVLLDKVLAPKSSRSRSSLSP